MQQSQQKVCITHQEVIVQKNHNDKDQCKTCMEIQYKNEIIKVEEAIKEQQMIIENQKLDKEYNLALETMKQQKIQLTKQFNDRVITYSQQKLRKFNYQIIKEYSGNYYRSFAFNQDSTLLFAGEYQVIKLFKFKNGHKLLQTLTTHGNFVFSLIFMNKSNLLVSASDDKSIVIWNQDYNTNWKPHQTLEGHQSCIEIIINNEDEDLLISGSYDKTIKFQRKINMNWSIKLNQALWNKKQIIEVNSGGRQLCFISDSKFLYQGEQECLEIYEFQQNERQFIKGKTIGVQNFVTYGNFGYPCKYLESMGFAVIQYGKYLNFF